MNFLRVSFLLFVFIGMNSHALTSGAKGTVVADFMNRCIEVSKEKGFPLEKIMDICNCEADIFEKYFSASQLEIMGGRASSGMPVLTDSQVMEFKEKLHVCNKESLDYYMEEGLGAAFRGDNKGAEKSLSLALEVMQKYGIEDQRKVMVKMTLGVVYKNLGRYDEARSLLIGSIADLKKMPGVDPSIIMSAKDNVAQIYYYQGRYKRAEELFETVLMTKEAESSGAGQLSVASTINNLGEVYRAQGHFDEALRLNQRALDIARQELGESAPDVATYLNNRGLLYISKHRYDEAEILIKQAMEIRGKTPSSEDPLDATYLNNLGLVYIGQKRYGQARYILKKALPIVEKSWGAEHRYVAATLDNLGKVYFKEGLYGMSGTYYKRALDIREKVLGIQHPKTAKTLFGLGVLYLREGRVNEAESLLKQSIDIQRRIGDGNYPGLVESLAKLSEVYRLKGMNSESDEYLQQSRAIQKRLGDTSVER